MIGEALQTKFTFGCSKNLAVKPRARCWPTCFASGPNPTMRKSSRTCSRLTAEEARELSNTIETRFADWASTPAECDYTGRHDLSQLASAFFRSCT